MIHPSAEASVWWSACLWRWVFSWCVVIFSSGNPYSLELYPQNGWLKMLLIIHIFRICQIGEEMRCFTLCGVQHDKMNRPSKQCPNFCLKPRAQCRRPARLGSKGGQRTSICIWRAITLVRYRTRYKLCRGAARGKFANKSLIRKHQEKYKI